jgi:hypothetical protein
LDLDGFFHCDSLIISVINPASELVSISGKGVKKMNAKWASGGEKSQSSFRNQLLTSPSAEGNQNLYQL